MNDVNSLSHTKWNCKYHIVFAPKYRRKVFYGEKRREIGEILRMLCNWKKVKIIEAEVCPDHIHVLLEIPPKVEAQNTANRANLTAFERSGQKPNLSGNTRYGESPFLEYVDMLKDMGYPYSEMLERMQL